MAKLFGALVCVTLINLLAAGYSYLSGMTHAESLVAVLTGVVAVLYIEYLLD